MNPLNKPDVDNALLYDVLLLLIFNVQHPVNVTKGFLIEYLDSLYQELGIEAECNPLEEFLMQNNLWSVEKLSSEFKKIHANKVSNVFSEKPLQRNQSPAHLVNPSDGRKYKRTIVEGHLSNLTFSPSLNPKTIELDQ